MLEKVGNGGDEGFSSFFPLKSTHPSSSTLPSAGSLQLILAQSWCCGQWFRWLQKVGGGSPSLPGWWCVDEWQLRGHQELCLPGTVGRSWCWTQQVNRCPFPSQRVWMRQEGLAVSTEGTWKSKAVPSHSFQAGKSCHRMSVQSVGTPCLQKEITVSSQEHTGRSLSQNILFRKLASQQQSRMLIWE